ncbi:lycopene cyclase family protein [Flavobacterium caeni]|uniref:Lycopene beta-cyclase n=1 Tax=Flavobacterium caeni TaxID=490189 RepID=A0A1G5HR68_9FLAO|nr:lycopene cyclase family protein [Flavobacterium caeni]SCY66365.1 lycopene beta-cyclase [Flavobacterium caeni]
MTYDYIFCGFGLSSMLILLELQKTGSMGEKRILVLEKDKDTQEKTWSFWERGKGEFDDLLDGSWSSGHFTAPGLTTEILGEYTYKSLRRSALSAFVLKRLSLLESVRFERAEVLSWADDGLGVTVRTNGPTYRTKKYFHSAPPDLASLGKKILLQHFIGWNIRTEQNHFEPVAEIMDFDVPQHDNTRFFYVLPSTNRSALVEYTLFSSHLLSESEYEDEIKQYLLRRGIVNYEIVSKERGVVPMTTYPFWKRNTRNVLHIGTAGGWTKASTGYTFYNAQKLSARLVRSLLDGNADFRKFFRKDRFYWYDAILIEVLCFKNDAGREIFTRLFKNNRPGRVLRFLNEATHWTEELSIVKSCPKWLFFRGLAHIIAKRGTPRPPNYN